MNGEQETIQKLKNQLENWKLAYSNIASKLDKIVRIIKENEVILQ